jgi:hypothetical protein
MALSYMTCDLWLLNPATGRVEFEIYQRDEQMRKTVQAYRAAVSRGHLETTFGITDDADLMDAAKTYARELEDEAGGRATAGQFGDGGGLQVVPLAT